MHIFASLIFYRVKLRIENFNETKDYEVDVFLHINAMLYTGTIKKRITKEKYSVNVNAGLGKYGKLRLWRKRLQRTTFTEKLVLSKYAVKFIQVHSYTYIY